MEKVDSTMELIERMKQIAKREFPGDRWFVDKTIWDDGTYKIEIRQTDGEERHVLQYRWDRPGVYRRREEKKEGVPHSEDIGMVAELQGPERLDEFSEHDVEKQKY